MADINLGLVRRCKMRDREAFSQLLARHEKSLYHLCFKYLGNKEDALDAVQDIFVKVFKNIDTFDENREFLPWLKKIAVNTCLNYRRDLRKKQHLSLDYENDEGWSVLENISSDEDVEGQVMAYTEREGIMEGLAQLPPGPKMVLTLHYLQGASYQEMAKILDQPLGTVKNSLFRARAMLKSVLLKKGLFEI